MPHTLVVRFSEITLKGRNRGTFQQRMLTNIRRHLDGHGTFRLQPGTARVVVETEDDPHTALDILSGLPGVANVSPARMAEREIEPLRDAVCEEVRLWVQERKARAGRREPAGPVSFKVEVARKDKRYGMGSMEVAADLGQALLERVDGLRVDLTRPELTLTVEIWESGAAIFSRKLQGPGGLAVGSSGKVLCLLSGGIDSPVAAYLLMTRGAEVVYLNFHSFPFIGERSKEKVHEIVRFLARYQPRSRLLVAPFAKAQEAIRDLCPEGLRTVLYRRMMNRVANTLAEREGTLAFVTGESLGQVASQTLENIRAIEATAKFPVLQPLIGHSKQDIVDIARKIGSYPISIQPFPDCCTLFQPRKPETRAKLERLDQAESRLPIDELVEECVAGLETTDYGPMYHPAGWE